MAVMEALLAVLALVAFWYWRRHRKMAVMPPGEWGVPVFGALPPSSEPMEDTILKLRKKYGDIFTWQIGGRTFVILCDFQTIKKMFNHQDVQSRPDFFSFQSFTKNQDLGLFNTNGIKWQKTRRFTLRHLRDMGMGRSTLEQAIAIEAQHLVDDFKKHTSEPTTIPMSISIAVLNVIWKLVSDNRFELNDPAIHDFQRLVIDLFVESQKNATIFDVFPYLVPITPNFVYRALGVDKYTNACDKFMDYVHSVVQEHKRSLDPNNPRDFIDEFLVELRQTKGDEAFSEDNLDACVADLFTAGSESTASTLRWILMYLAKYPEVQAKMQREMDEVVPRDRLPGLGDRSQLNYTEAVFHEVQRLVSFTPIAAPHLLTADMELQGYKIPKNTVIVGHMEGCHRNPDYWEKPNEFYPEHFLDEHGKFKTKKEGYVPFSIGRRVCPGEGLAKLNIYLFGSALVHSFTFSAPPGVEISLERDPTEILLRMPQPLKLVIKDRNRS